MMGHRRQVVLLHSGVGPGSSNVGDVGGARVRKMNGTVAGPLFCSHCALEVCLIVFARVKMIDYFIAVFLTIPLNNIYYAFYDTVFVLYRICDVMVRRR